MKYIPLLFLLRLTGCMVAPTESSDSAQNLTVGTVQKEIRLGMTGADVASVLGSPNIVSTDAERREVWIYDKVATDYVSTSANGWVFALVAGGSKSSRSASRTAHACFTCCGQQKQPLLARLLIVPRTRGRPPTATPTAPRLPAGRKQRAPPPLRVG